VLRIVEHPVVAVASLNDAPFIHDDHAVRDLLHHPEIMADEEPVDSVPPDYVFGVSISREEPEPWPERFYEELRGSPAGLGLVRLGVQSLWT
jgi:hypothetical protein